MQNLFLKKRINAIEKELGYSYRQGRGELLYALITCRPDISYPSIKLSQYSTKLARIHYDAIRAIYQYLKCTKVEGTHHWKKVSLIDLPLISSPIPMTDYNNYTPHTGKLATNPIILDIQVDASYANDSEIRKLVTSIVPRIVGSTIIYKTRFQDVIVHSSTEIEFITACDAGKNCLYIRSILDDKHIPQEDATIIYKK